MKNIHILPTDKPSRLCINGKNQMHIYITSDEEIKEGDYAYHKTFRVGKITNVNREECFVTIKLNPTDGSVTTPWKRNIPDIKKIILTTDIRLAPDVQKIDDEFLEWFVKNPSCESVEVENVYKTASINFGNQFNYYKIIIPKEEPDYSALLQPVGTRQETIVEAAERFVEAKQFRTEEKDKSTRYCFIQGAKWQQERSYSEEEVLEIIRQYAFEKHLITSSKPDIWFNQFKKK